MLLKIFFKRFYLFIREMAGTKAGAKAKGEGDADLPLSRDPDSELDPRAWRS